MTGVLDLSLLGHSSLGRRSIREAAASRPLARSGVEVRKARGKVLTQTAGRARRVRCICLDSLHVLLGSGSLGLLGGRQSEGAGWERVTARLLQT